MLICSLTSFSILISVKVHTVYMQRTKNSKFPQDSIPHSIYPSLFLKRRRALAIQPPTYLPTIQPSRSQQSIQLPAWISFRPDTGPQLRRCLLQRRESSITNTTRRRTAKRPSVLFYYIYDDNTVSLKAFPLASDEQHCQLGSGIFRYTRLWNVHYRIVQSSI